MRGSIVPGSVVVLVALAQAAPAAAQCGASGCGPLPASTSDAAVRDQPQQSARVEKAAQTQRPVVQPRASVAVRKNGLGLGIRSHVTLDRSNELLLFGFGGALRYITGSRFGVELSGDVTGTSDTWSFPVELSGLVFFNIARHIQPLLIIGADFNSIGLRDRGITLLYSGGHIGVGVEFLLSSVLGIGLDFRHHVQGLVYNKGRDDNVEELEYGFSFNVGINFYL